LIDRTLAVYAAPGPLCKASMLEEDPNLTPNSTA